MLQRFVCAYESSNINRVWEAAKFQGYERFYIQVKWGRFPMPESPSLQPHLSPIIDTRLWTMAS